VRGNAADILPKRLVYSTNDANSVRHANALVTFKLHFSLQQLASSGLSDCFARREDRRCEVALSNGWERTGGGNSFAWFRGDFADVATDHAVARAKVDRDRAGFAGHW
jgi:hypothetical protein